MDEAKLVNDASSRLDNTDVAAAVSDVVEDDDNGGREEMNRPNPGERIWFGETITTRGERLGGTVHLITEEGMTIVTDKKRYIHWPLSQNWERMTHDEMQATEGSQCCAFPKLTRDGVNNHLLHNCTGCTLSLSQKTVGLKTEYYPDRDGDIEAKVIKYMPMAGRYVIELELPNMKTMKLRFTREDVFTNLRLSEELKVRKHANLALAMHLKTIDSFPEGIPASVGFFHNKKSIELTSSNSMAYQLSILSNQIAHGMAGENPVACLQEAQDLECKTRSHLPTGGFLSFNSYLSLSGHFTLLQSKNIIEAKMYNGIDITKVGASLERFLDAQFNRCEKKHCSIILSDNNSHALMIAYDYEAQKFYLYECQEEVRSALTENDSSVFKYWEKNHVLRFITRNTFVAYNTIYCLLLALPMSPLSAFVVYYGRKERMILQREDSKTVKESFKMMRTESSSSDLQIANNGTSLEVALFESALDDTHVFDMLSNYSFEGDEDLKSCIKCNIGAFVASMVHCYDLYSEWNKHEKTARQGWLDLYQNQNSIELKDVVTKLKVLLQEFRENHNEISKSIPPEVWNLSSTILKCALESLKDRAMALHTKTHPCTWHHPGKW